MGMNARHRLLIWFITLALILQGIPAAAVMVGCSMGSKQAGCSKWSDPKQTLCCCGSMGESGASCRMSGMQGRTLASSSGTQGCVCQFISKTVPERVVRTDFGYLALVQAPAILPAPLTLALAVAEPDPYVFGTDSSPPTEPPLSAIQPRAPPIAPVRLASS